MGDVVIDGNTGANRLVFLDANGKIPALDGSAVTQLNGTNFTSGPIPIARFDVGTSANKIVQLDGNAKLPAVSGGNLTNMVEVTQSSNDPTVSTNPSGGVGTEWHNTSTGEVYVLTDATAGANVWMNVGEGSGDVEPWAFQGESYGYSSGGYPYPSSPLNIIDKFSFTSNANATDVGDITVARSSTAGQSSSTHGYTSASAATNVVDKFSFTTDGNATDVGNLTVSRGECAGQSSTTHGYCAGGIIGGPPFDSNYIDKFTFASDANATDVGDLTGNRRYPTGQSSTTYGYTSGGFLYPNSINVIDKFSFATDGNATDVGDLTTARQILAGQQY